MGIRSRRTESRTMPLVRVAVLSDDRLFCEGLVRILASEVSFIPVAYEAVTDVPASPRPHVLLMDSRMSGSLMICRSLTFDDSPALIFIAAPDDDQWASEALNAGARGILAKSAHAEDMIRAVRSVREGQIWARRRVMAARIDYLAGIAAARQVNDAAGTPRLSIREIEVFRHAASGLRNKELADRLAISEATVKVHLTHIFQKLGVQGRAELAAAYHGVVRPPEVVRPKN